jgi:hypothetical protein
MKIFIEQNLKISKRSKMMIKKFLRIEIMEPQNFFGTKKLKKPKNQWVCLLKYELSRKTKIIKMAIKSNNFKKVINPPAVKF